VLAHRWPLTGPGARCASGTLEPEETLDAPPVTEFVVTTVLSIVLIIASLLMVLLVLLHRGKGGGLSDMFGGGVSSSLSGSSVVEKNLDRLTILCGIVWAACVIGLGFSLK
jgi:preprotein translocase subunit SecG